MKKYFIFVLLLIFVNEPLFAGNSYSSGGGSRSFSSGSRSSGSSFSGRSSFSGSRSSGISGSRSYSSPSTGRSYSSRSHSTPSHSAPSNKSYSSGSPKPETPSVTPNSGSNKSYSSGSPKPVTPNEKSKQSFSGGNSTNKPPPDTNSKKPNSNNSDLSNAAKKEESKIRYQAANSPKSSYTTPKGETKPIQSNSQPVQTVRNYVTHERYITYDNRARSFYSPYYGYPQPYNDFFSPFLMGYLFSSAINSHDRAMWVYNHRDQMDDYRYQQLLEKDAELKARLQVLEQQQTKKDSNYVLPGMEDNPDLQYSKEFIDSAYNSVPAQSAQEEASGFGIFWILIGVILVVIVVYYLCIKEY